MMLLYIYKHISNLHNILARLVLVCFFGGMREGAAPEALALGSCPPASRYLPLPWPFSDIPNLSDGNCPLLTFTLQMQSWPGYMGYDRFCVSFQNTVFWIRRPLDNWFGDKLVLYD